ncbi:MAG: 2Fe-2S iron-sulfur cluster binding domain-containing protein [Candidatus Latescibacteria bacterium]|nr:2Fe-2S iron-sulfur cluster binding domain-containing protein [Candidatus Latescibacterota bacterium]
MGPRLCGLQLQGVAIIELTVNGTPVQWAGEGNVPLLYILRNDLDLKGAKLACGLEQCGACKVLVDGCAVPSCRLPVEQVQGQQVVTVEGLGGQELHPVQRAFIAENAAQCGYCTAGMVVAAKALLDRVARPTEQQIREELRVHLCRCGVYGRVIKAVQRAAEEMGG